MSGKAKLELALRRRAISRDSITSLEQKVTKFEEKESLLPVEHIAVQQLAKRIDSLDAEY